MPVYHLRCPDCQHEFRGLVLEGTKQPSVWVCSKCGSKSAQPNDEAEAEPHPLESESHGGGCPCCG